MGLSFIKNHMWLLLLVVLVVGFIGNYIYRLPKFSSGEQAKDFSSKLINNNDFTLSDLRGTYILLDFWGSWCGPCRKENKELVKLYDDFENKKFKDAAKFEIVSVGVETQEVSWQKAIEIDGLRWNYHILQNNRFSSEIVKLYGVREIPTKYLISPEGMILSVNESVGNISKFLLERVEE